MNKLVHRMIAFRVSHLRAELPKQLSISDNKEIVRKFEKLVLYVLDNFGVISSKENYIYENMTNLKNDALRSSEGLKLYMVNKQYIKNTPRFSLELPLRAIEASFVYGDFDVSEEQALKLQELLNDFYIISIE